MCLQGPGLGALQSGHEQGLQLHQDQHFQRTEQGFHPKTDAAHTADRKQLD